LDELEEEEKKQFNLFKITLRRLDGRVVTKECERPSSYQNLQHQFTLLFDKKFSGHCVVETIEGSTIYPSTSSLSREREVIFREIPWEVPNVKGRMRPDLSVWWEEEEYSNQCDDFSTVLF